MASVSRTAIKRIQVETTEYKETMKMPSKGIITKKKTRKKLPDDISMQATMFGDGAKGMAVQIYVNEEHGVTMTCLRPTRNTAWQREFTHINLPNKVFTTYEAMQKAVNKK